MISWIPVIVVVVLMLALVTGVVIGITVEAERTERILKAMPKNLVVRRKK